LPPDLEKDLGQYCFPRGFVLLMAQHDAENVYALAEGNDRATNFPEYKMMVAEVRHVDALSV
jgi:hypothetical protein